MEHILPARSSQHHQSLHSLEKKTNTTSNRGKLCTTNKLHCRGDADQDIGWKAKAMFNNARLAHKQQWDKESSCVSRFSWNFTEQMYLLLNDKKLEKRTPTKNEQDGILYFCKPSGKLVRIKRMKRILSLTTQGPILGVRADITSPILTRSQSLLIFEVKHQEN